MTDNNENYEDELLENEPCDSCPRCLRFYDEIDHQFQSCSKCGWDEEKKIYSKEVMRQPNEDDYMNGDSDILTG